MMTLAVRSVLSPRIGRRRALSRPWSHFDPVVGVLLGVVQSVAQQLVDDRLESLKVPRTALLH
jgi:hypothetical protein